MSTMLSGKVDQEGRTSNIELKTTNDEQGRERVTAPMLEVSLFDSLIRTNTRTRMIQTKQKEKNTMRERQMKECVCAEPCEGMLEDMPVTGMKSMDEGELK